jgi:hypothetical protein
MTVRRSILFMAAAMLLTFCAPPSDEAWFRIVGFGNPTTTGTDADPVTITADGVDTDTPGTISVLDSDLRDSETDRVDVFLENYSTIVGTSDGRGVYVYRAEVEYLFGAYSLPRYEYPVTLALPPPGAEGGVGEGTLEDLPLVPASLKGWLLANLPAEVTAAPFQIEARVTIRARSGEGTELETSGSLGIIF